MMEKIMEVKNGITHLQNRCMPGDVKIMGMLKIMDENMNFITREYMMLVKLKEMEKVSESN